MVFHHGQRHRLPCPKQDLFLTLHKNINHIDATTYGELWLGTTTGEILSFDTQTKKITNHSATCNMSGDIINGLVSVS